MGLSFLNKKIWHPGSFNNIEKVWIAEQKQKEKERKMIDKAKKIKEEKAIEELKNIQVQNGLLSPNHIERVEFMYQAPDNNAKIISPEEFLLGKPITDDDNKKQIIPVIGESFSNPQNEMFSKIHEDPLVLIKKEEMKRRKEIEDNPYKMGKIMREVREREIANKINNINKVYKEKTDKEYKDVSDSDSENDKYKKKKHHHKHHHNHHHHKEHHKERYESDDDDEEEEDYRRNKYKDRKKIRKGSFELEEEE